MKPTGADLAGADPEKSEGTEKEIWFMRKKCNILGICSFGIALVIFVFTYFLYHHLSPDGIFAAIYQLKPVKPFITLLFGIWGVTFLFASVFSFLVGLVFFRKK